MRELDEILEDLWAKRTEYKKMVEQRDSLSATTPNQAMRDELSKTVQRFIESARPSTFIAGQHIIAVPAAQLASGYRHLQCQFFKPMPCP